MSARQTYIWVAIALALFGFIMVFERNAHSPPSGPTRILPELKPEEVTSIQVRLAGPIPWEIRADRTNGSWVLTQPLIYPARAAGIEELLAGLTNSTSAIFLTGAELRGRPNADEEYGFGTPQASIIIVQGGERIQLLVGSRTPPGDQVYVQVVAKEGAYVVDADLLKLIPRSANDWRDTTLVNLDGLAFDRLAVTNNAKIFVLQRDSTNQLWRMVWPFTKGARADNARIEDGLKKLGDLQVVQFVSDRPRQDLDTFGLDPAELEVGFSQGTNRILLLQFGRSPTNVASQVYARRALRDAVFTVDKDLQSPWRAASVNDFRDPHLLTLTEPVDSIEVFGTDHFSVRYATNQGWRVLPGDFPADAGLVKDFLAALSSVQIVVFEKDVVNPPDLPGYGLADPACRYVLKRAVPAGVGAETNQVMVELSFGLGTNQPDKVFARRADESSVYALAARDVAHFPVASWEFRERRVWHVEMNEISGVTIRQNGKTRQLLRNGPHQWSLAPGSQGIINDLAVEETARALVQVSSAFWVARGDQARARYGFSDQALQISFELKDGAKRTIEFGGQAPSSNVYAAVTLDGGVWIFEFPWFIYRDVVSYLAIPSNP
jgi:hypothetical protein